jgi:hypothetical protein
MPSRSRITPLRIASKPTGRAKVGEDLVVVVKPLDREFGLRFPAVNDGLSRTFNDSR